MNNQPPKLPLRFLRWFCHPDLLPSIEGDLVELYEERVANAGRTKANWLLVWDVVRLFRPSIIRTIEGTYKMNQYGLLKNHLKISVRSLRRNALFTTINVFGLAVSMMVGVLMIAILLDLTSYDDFHENKESIYRVTSTIHRDSGARKYASSSLYVGQQIKENIPGIDNVLLMQQGWVPEITKDDQSAAVEATFVSGEFFEMFSYNLLEGNPTTVLSEPYSVVLSKSAAYKLFNDEPAVGKSIRIAADNKSVSGVVTGVYENMAFNSHLQLQALVSMASLQQMAKDDPGHYMYNRESMWITQVYLQVHDQSSIPEIQATLHELNKIDNAEGGMQITNELQPLNEIVPSEDYNNQFGPFYSRTLVNIMMVLTLVVLASASFNYTNLSLARALRRSKEVAIRKITGASRFHVFSQFVTEAIVLALVALVIGIVGFFFVREEVLALPTDSSYQIFNLELAWPHIIYALALALAVGFAAGLVPAIFLSKLRANAIFRDASLIKVFSGMSLRKVLITFQFSLAIGLITFSTMIYKQYHYAIGFDLGYNTENILNIWVHKDKIALLENELNKLPEVSETASAALVMGTSWTQGNQAVSSDRMDTFRYDYNHVDEKFMDMLGIELLAGRSFIEKSASDSSLREIVINQTFADRLGFRDPSAAPGTHVWCNEEEVVVCGVVKDFIYSSLREHSIAPFLFRQVPEETDLLLLGVKVASNDRMRTRDKIERIFKDIDPAHEFDAEFYDDRIAGTYEEHMVTYKVISFLSLLAISIAFLGLLGIVVYAMESRMKEISVRKVLGASARHLSVMLTRPFGYILIISALIGVPTAVWLLEKYVLSEFKYRITLATWDVLLGTTAVFLIALLTVLWQVRSATSQNPADLLRDE